jgi:hypothetical protein
VIYEDHIAQKLKFWARPRRYGGKRRTCCPASSIILSRIFLLSCPFNAGASRETGAGFSAKVQKNFPCPKLYGSIKMILDKSTFDGTQEEIQASYPAATPPPS